MSEGKIRQLCAFVEFEREHNPHPSGQQHIAGWAYEEIQRLQGEKALSDAFMALPKSAHKAAFWQAQGPALKKAAKTADGGAA